MVGFGFPRLLFFRQRAEEQLLHSIVLYPCSLGRKRQNAGVSESRFLFTAARKITSPVYYQAADAVLSSTCQCAMPDSACRAQSRSRCCTRPVSIDTVGSQHWQLCYWLVASIPMPLSESAIFSWERFCLGSELRINGDRWAELFYGWSSKFALVRITFNGGGSFSSADGAQVREWRVCDR